MSTDKGKDEYLEWSRNLEANLASFHVDDDEPFDQLSFVYNKGKYFRPQIVLPFQPLSKVGEKSDDQRRLNALWSLGGRIPLTDDYNQLNYVARRTGAIQMEENQVPDHRKAAKIAQTFNIFLAMKESGEMDDIPKKHIDESAERFLKMMQNKKKENNTRSRDEERDGGAGPSEPVRDRKNDMNGMKETRKVEEKKNDEVVVVKEPCGSKKDINGNDLPTSKKSKKMKKSNNQPKKFEVKENKKDDQKNIENKEKKKDERLPSEEWNDANMGFGLQRHQKKKGITLNNQSKKGVRYELVDPIPQKKLNIFTLLEDETLEENWNEVPQPSKPAPMKPINRGPSTGRRQIVDINKSCLLRQMKSPQEKKPSKK